MNNNIEAATRKLKRMSLSEGDKREEKKRRAFIKPSVRAQMVRNRIYIQTDQKAHFAASSTLFCPMKTDDADRV